MTTPEKVFLWVFVVPFGAALAVAAVIWLMAGLLWLQRAGPMKPLV